MAKASHATPTAKQPDPQKNRDRLSTYAHAAIDTHVHTVLQHEMDVLQDTDPEAVHQMRVGMRRLRTTLQAYGLVLRLPSAAREKPIKKLARTLGQVRDLDVLIARLQEQYYERLPDVEQQALEQVMRSLHKQRKPAFAKLEKALNGKHYRHFKAAYQDWLEQPRYTALEDYTIDQVLPDLLLPLMSRLLLHRGWLVGHELHPDTDTDTINRWLDEEGHILHDLRKQMKQVRYQTEFFTSFYDSAYKKQVKELKTIQDLLGQLQDCWVLNQVLEQHVGLHWRQQLPTLATLLQGDRYSLWVDWYPIQQRYLNTDLRHKLRMLVAQPQTVLAQAPSDQEDQSQN